MRLLPVVLLFVTFCTLTTGALQPSPLAAQPTPTPPGIEEEQRLIEEAIQQRIQTEELTAMAFFMYQNEVQRIQVAPQTEVATAWLVPTDPATGEVVPAEPGLVMLERGPDGWNPILPSDDGWTAAVENAPTELLSAEEKDTWLAMAAVHAVTAPDAPLRGYLLPFRGGERLAMTQSVHHDRYTPSLSAHYAFDFSTSPSGLFNVHAAKSGTVFRARDDCRNGDEECSNYLVLLDTSTSPVTYQLYLHLAQDSIPPAFKTIGAFVARGDFIGVADDTGTSSNHHLHFHVHAYSGHWWGTSLDIVFDDVTINGGRPRITIDQTYCRNDSTYQDVCDQTQTFYTSANYPSGDRNPPTGGILSPLNGAEIRTPSVHLEGWGQDESGVESAQFLAKYNGAWQQAGPSLTGQTFATDWDLCAAGVPDGPVSLAVRLQDINGNVTPGLTGLRHFIKHAECEAPAPTTCTPGTNQVALFADADYRGECMLFGEGNYDSASLGALGDNNAEAIQVGANVQATLYGSSGWTGRAETFLVSDAGLGDNAIGANQVSALVVWPRLALPNAPRPVFPANGASLPPGSYLYFAWENGGGAQEYQIEMLTPEGNFTSPWVKSPAWAYGPGPAGSYVWKVRARNANGVSTSTSADRIVTILSPNPAAASATAVTAPFSDGMETGTNGWTNTNFWDQTTFQNHTDGGNISWGIDVNDTTTYDNGEPVAADLTSPPITIPGAGYFLRFWYLYGTEGAGRHWDQRKIQIANGDGPFIDVWQLSDDPPNFWLQSPVLDLSAYAGQTIRVRFHFETVDARNNAFSGWFIDDFTITADPPPDCGAPPDGNDTPGSATPLTPGTSVQGAICPGGDFDYFRFSAPAGAQIGAAAQAQVIGSPLDTHLFLYGADGLSPFAENDDLVNAQVTDSFLTFPAERAGEYVLLLRAWDNPRSGGAEFVYNLRLYTDDQEPEASMVFPKDGFALPQTPFSVSVQADDGSGSGIDHVLFWWHSGDWLNDDWLSLGEDLDGSDGWSALFDPSGLGFQTGMAVYAQVFDRAGNWTPAAAWNVSLPKSVVYFPLVRVKP